jgi:hypothetical protein
MDDKTCKLCGSKIMNPTNFKRFGQAIPNEICKKCLPLFGLTLTGEMTIECASFEGKRIRMAILNHRGMPGVCN